MSRRGQPRIPRFRRWLSDLLFTLAEAVHPGYAVWVTG